MIKGNLTRRTLMRLYLSSIFDWLDLIWTLFGVFY